MKYLTSNSNNRRTSRRVYSKFMLEVFLCIVLYRIHLQGIHCLCKDLFETSPVFFKPSEMYFKLSNKVSKNIIRNSIFYKVYRKPNLFCLNPVKCNSNNELQKHQPVISKAQNSKHKVQSTKLKSKSSKLKAQSSKLKD